MNVLHLVRADIHHKLVLPAQAGIQRLKSLDTGQQHAGMTIKWDSSGSVPFLLSVFGHALPEHFVADFEGRIAEVGEFGKLVLEQFVGMRLLMLVEGLPVGDDDDVAHVLLDALVRPVVHYRAFIGNEAGVFVHLATDETAIVVAIVILDHVAHFAQHELDIANTDAFFQIDNVE